MDPVKAKRNLCLLLLMIIPLISTIGYVCSRSTGLLLATGIYFFLFVWLVPICKHKENLWMFILVAIASVPINILVIYEAIFVGLLTETPIVAKFLWGVLLYCVVFSVEEIVFGLVTRIIWRKQYKLL